MLSGGMKEWFQRFDIWAWVGDYSIKIQFLTKAVTAQVIATGSILVQNTTEIPTKYIARYFLVKKMLNK